MANVTASRLTVDDGTITWDDMTIDGTLTASDLTISGTSTTIGTVTSGIWNAGAVTSSGTVTAASLSAQSGQFVTSSTGSSSVVTIGAHGTHNAVLNSPESFFINIDSNATQTTRYFAIGADGTTDGTTSLFKVLETGYVGIGETSPANLLHVKASDTGIAPHGSAQIVLERDGTNYLQFLTGNDGTSGLLFGDEDDNAVSRIYYDHNVKTMYFEVEDDQSVITIDADVGDKRITFGDANDEQTTEGLLYLNPNTHTVGANRPYHYLYMSNNNVITIPSGTASIVTGMNIEIPNITATGTVTLTSTVRIAGAMTEGTTNYALLVDAGTSRFDGNLVVNGSAFFGSAGTNYDVRFYGDTSGQDLSWDAGSSGGCLIFDDNTKAKFGDGGDLEISHDGSDSYIRDTGTGSLVVGSSLFHVMNSGLSENMIYATENGAVTLYYDNSAKFATTSTGILTEGSNLDVHLRIKSTGTNSYPTVRFQNDARTWRLYGVNGAHGDSVNWNDETANKWVWTLTADHTMILGNYTAPSAWAADYYAFEIGSKTNAIHGHNSASGSAWIGITNNAFINTSGNWEATYSSNGHSNIYLYNGYIYFRTDAAVGAGNAVSWISPMTISDRVTFTVDSHYGDNDSIYLGASDDMRIRHDGNHSYVMENGTGNMIIGGTQVYLKNAVASETMVGCIENGAVTLYYDNSAKLATSSAGVSVTGALTASGNITAYSDARLKENVKPINSALKKVGRMKGVTYDRIDSGEAGVGVLAQDLEKIAPELVQDGEYKSVAYGNLTAYLVEAIKELKQKVEDLENGTDR